MIDERLDTETKFQFQVMDMCFTNPSSLVEMVAGIEIVTLSTIRHSCAAFVVKKLKNIRPTHLFSPDRA